MSKKYFIIAGEASGDMHAARLIEALHHEDATAEFVGLGGDRMKEAGCRLVQHYSKMAYMGVFAVLAHLGQIRRNFQIAQDALLREQPAALILIDYPSFNLKIARFCRTHLPETKIYYYIPPKVWAWKTHRIHAIARLCDEVFGIFPFEPSFYAQYGYHCTYVGNPTAEELEPLTSSLSSEETVHSSPNTIALLPGSRRHEIRSCLPMMIESAKKMGDGYVIEVAAAPGIEETFYTPYIYNKGVTLVHGSLDLVKRAKAAIVNSGTATLETALLDCPQVAVYHVACSKWLWWLQPILFKIKHFTLVNLIPDKEVIQEMVARRFTVRETAAELRRILEDADYRQAMKKDYQSIRDILGTSHAAVETAKKINFLTK